MFEKIQEEKLGEVSPSLQPAKPSSATPSAGSNAARNSRLKSYAPITDEEKTFDIPENWCWCRLGEICDYLHRGKSPTYGTDKLLPIMAQKCNQWDKIYTDKCLFAEKKTIERYTEEQYLKVGDTIVNSTGGGTVGRTGYIDKYVFSEYSKFVADSHVTVIRGNNRIFGKYIYYYLLSPTIQICLEDRCSGSTNQIELGTETIKNYSFSLPPLAEQKEIVTRIESLLKTVEELETQIQTRQTLAKQLMQGILKDAFKER